MRDRTLTTAVILAIGSELTTGATRDTNSGQLAGELSGSGIAVLYTSALPDRLEPVADAFRAAIATADLVVSTGGLGPTPDDLTREAISAATGLEPAVDPDLERWLRALFERRQLRMPDTNLKQAWLVPGATALRNEFGTAPGWWLDLADGAVLVALPGPPREMTPMWRSEVVPRLRRRAAGADVAWETLRLTGIGESALVELVGEAILRNPEPEVATYARPDAVDLRITARGPGAAARVSATVDELLAKVGRYVFARGDEGWSEVIGRMLAGRTLRIIEVGTDAQVLALLGRVDGVSGDYLGRSAGGALERWAEREAAESGRDLVLVVRASSGDLDTRVEIAISAGGPAQVEERTAFLGGAEGRRRAALAAATGLWQFLRDNPAP